MHLYDDEDVKRDRILPFSSYDRTAWMARFLGSLDSQSVKQVERAYSIIESVVHAVASSPRRANCTHYRRYRNTEDCAGNARFERSFFASRANEQWNQLYRRIAWMLYIKVRWIYVTLCEMKIFAGYRMCATNWLFKYFVSKGALNILLDLKYS